MEYYHTTESQAKTIANSLKYSITGSSVEDAEDLFVYAKNSLLSVNNWKQYSPAINTSFELTNNNGYVLHRRAHTGDNIRVSSPDGTTCWLHIDSIVYDDYPDAGTESIAINLVPCGNSLSVGPGGQVRIDLESLEHQSVFTFAIERSGIHLSTLCSGAEDLLALPAEQLQNLISGFIDFEEK